MVKELKLTTVKDPRDWYDCQTEYVREVCSVHLTDEQLSDGWEYLASLQEQVRILNNRLDWSPITVLSKKIVEIKRLLQDE